MSDLYLEAATLNLAGLLAVYDMQPTTVMNGLEGHANAIIEAWVGDRERTRWCEEHDLPYRMIRTDDDRMVCWYVWWSEAMERANKLTKYPLEYTEGKPCRSGERIVVRVSVEGNEQ